MNNLSVCQLTGKLTFFWLRRERTLRSLNFLDHITDHICASRWHSVYSLVNDSSDALKLCSTRNFFFPTISYTKTGNLLYSVARISVKKKVAKCPTKSKIDLIFYYYLHLWPWKKYPVVICWSKNILSPYLIVNAHLIHTTTVNIFFIKVNCLISLIIKVNQNP